MATSDYDMRDEDRLPWLETADDDFNDGPSIGRIVAFVVLGLALIAAAIFGVYWYKNYSAQPGGGGLIAAQTGDYKVKPDEPGGMKVEGEGDTAFATSEGAAGNSHAAIDLKAVPEAPVAGKKAAPAPAPALNQGKSVALPVSGGKLAAAPAGAAPAKSAVPAPKPAAGGAMVQLTSAPSEAAANAVWSSLSKRFGYLAPLSHSVAKAEVNGRTVYRLRATAGSAADAATLCGKLKVAGEGCFVAH